MLINDYLEIFMIAFTVFTIGIASVKNIHCAIALAFSLCSALLLSSANAAYLHYHMMIFCAAICFIEVKGKKLVLLNQSKNEVNYAVAYVYLIRMLFGLWAIMGLISWELAWVMSSFILLSLQNLLILGGAFSGSSKRLNTTLSDSRNFVNGAVFYKN